MKLCSKPRCAAPGAVVLAYDYSSRVALLQDPPDGEVSPHLYVLCARCAERLNPPLGWTLEDLRTTPPLFLERVPERVPALRPDEPDASEEELAPVGRQLFFGSSS